jgi:transketolase
VIRACREAKAHRGQPSLIVAHTVKGKGVSYMEHDYNWHSKVMTKEEYERALADIAAVVES